MINTKTLLHLKNCPLLYHIVALPNLIHQLEEKKQNNPQLVFTTSDSLQIKKKKHKEKTVKMFDTESFQQLKV